MLWQRCRPFRKIRAARVVTLIEDLAELEARENAEDLAAARDALIRIATGEGPVLWKTVKASLAARIAELEAIEAAQAGGGAGRCKPEA